MIRARVLPRLAVLLAAALPGRAGALSPASPPASHPAAHAPRIVDCRMDVRLLPEEKEIHGTEELTWRNTTDASTDQLWFHLYLNAFRNEKSTFLVESGGKHRRSELEAGKWGWESIDTLRIAGGEDLTGTLRFMHPDDDNEDDRTVARAMLPRPVAPGDSIRLRISFRTHLQQVFARSGYRRDFFMAGQWFPKIGVFQGDRGWNCHQYHAHSEFFSDFGRYDVRITLPDRFVVGATGERVEETSNEEGTKSVRYVQADVHDFAWTACPDYRVFEEDFIGTDAADPAEIDSLAHLFCLPPEAVALPDVRMILLIQPAHVSQVERHFEALRNALKYYGLWFGPYPYRTITMFDPPRGAEDAGGMEYPTFIGAGTRWIQPADALNPEAVIVHEFGHQFWYGLAASNEFEEPWLDEGFTTYSTERVLAAAYGDNRAYRRFTGREGIPFPGVDWLQIDTHTDAFGRIDLPLFGIYLEPVPVAAFEGPKRAYLGGPTLDRLNENSWSFYNDASYWINAYSRPALTLRTLENLLGATTMARVMRAYQGRFRYRHPTTADFLETVREVSGIDLGPFLHQALEGSEILDYAVDAVTSDTLDVRRGIFDSPEGPIEVGGESDPRDAPRHLETESGEPVIESEVRLRRLGGFVQPVDLLVTFADGEIVRERWDGVERWKKYRYRRSVPLRSAEIDPLDQILLDVDRSNNSRTLEADRRPVLRWASRWLLWTQNYLHLAAAFG